MRHIVSWALGLWSEAKTEAEFTKAIEQVRAEERDNLERALELSITKIIEIASEATASKIQANKAVIDAEESRFKAELR